MNASRIKYYDGLKFICIFLVCVFHFIAFFDEALFEYWNVFPSRLILKVINGKCGVALLGLLMCRFAYCTGMKKKYSISKYVIRRYVYFILFGFLINLIYLIFYSVKAGVQAFELSYILKVTLLLGADIFPTFWFVKPFFLASVFAYLLGFVREKEQSILVRLFFVLIFVICNNVWVSVCLMGTFIPDIEEKREIWCKKWTKYVCFAAYYILIRNDDSDSNYFMYGICSLLLIMLIEGSDLSKKILSNDLISKMGGWTMSMLIIHPLTYQMAGGFLINSMNGIPHRIALIISFVLCFMIILLISWPLTNFMDLIYRKIITVSGHACERIADVLIGFQRKKL